MKKTFLAIIFSISTILLYAVPAKLGYTIFTQPDGTQIKIQRVGDEHFHYTLSEDGYLIKKSTDGYYRFATMNAEGVVSESEFICRPALMRSSSENNFLQIVAKNNDFRAIASQVADRRYSHHRRQLMNNTTPYKAWKNFVGGQKYLVILVNYSDLSFVNTKQDIDDLLNKKGYDKLGAVGSARDYFEFSSDGVFSPQFDVVGPYTLSKKMAYYGANDASGYDAHPEEMVEEACRLALADGINLKQYDTNNDGFVDNICIYYAGEGEATGGSDDTIWPHCFFLSNSPTVGNVKINDYIVMQELNTGGSTGTYLTTIGVFCHEFSHFMGLPDLYKTDKSNGSTVYNWDVMDMGCYNGPNERAEVPCGYSSYEKFYFGWNTPNILTQSNNYSLKSTSTKEQPYLITESGEHNLDGRNPSPNQFYIIENRTKNLFDKYLPSDGLLVWRIVFDKNKWKDNSPNNRQPYVVSVVPADNVMNRASQKMDTYPQRDIKSLMFSSYDGKKWGWALQNISKNGGVVNFTFLGDGSTINKTKEDNPFVMKPTNNHSWVIISKIKGKYKVSAYSVSGKLIEAKDFEEKTEIDTGSLHKGVYIIIVENLSLSIDDEKYFYSQKIIK